MSKKVFALPSLSRVCVCLLFDQVYRCETHSSFPSLISSSALWPSSLHCSQIIDWLQVSFGQAINLLFSYGLPLTDLLFYLPSLFTGLTSPASALPGNHQESALFSRQLSVAPGSPLETAQLGNLCHGLHILNLYHKHSSLILRSLCSASGFTNTHLDCCKLTQFCCLWKYTSCLSSCSI